MCWRRWDDHRKEKVAEMKDKVLQFSGVRSSAFVFSAPQLWAVSHNISMLFKLPDLNMQNHQKDELFMNSTVGH